MKIVNIKAYYDEIKMEYRLMFTLKDHIVLWSERDTIEGYLMAICDLFISKYSYQIFKLDNGDNLTTTENIDGEITEASRGIGIHPKDHDLFKKTLIDENITLVEDK